MAFFSGFSNHHKVGIQYENRKSQKLEVRKEESYVKYTEIFSQCEEYFWQQWGNE